MEDGRGRQRRAWGARDFLAIAVVLYTVSWTLVGPPGTVPLTATESATKRNGLSKADLDVSAKLPE